MTLRSKNHNIILAGFIHETHTITEMLPDVSTVTGTLSNEFTWFPGYAWRYVHCSHCGNHLGWKYFAEKPNLMPKYFYGLSGKSIKVENAQDQDEEENASLTMLLAGRA